MEQDLEDTSTDSKEATDTLSPSTPENSSCDNDEESSTVKGGVSSDGDSDSDSDGDGIDAVNEMLLTKAAAEEAQFEEREVVNPNLKEEIEAPFVSAASDLESDQEGDQEEAIKPSVTPAPRASSPAPPQVSSSGETDKETGKGPTVKRAAASVPPTSSTTASPKAIPKAALPKKQLPKAIPVKPRASSGGSPGGTAKAAPKSKPSPPRKETPIPPANPRRANEGGAQGRSGARPGPSVTSPSAKRSSSRGGVLESKIPSASSQRPTRRK